MPGFSPTRLLSNVPPPLSAQRWLWTGAYALLALAVASCTLVMPTQSTPAQKRALTPAPSRAQFGGWALLGRSVGPDFSTTLHLTTDIVAMPLLWVIPLGALRPRSGFQAWTDDHASLLPLISG